MKQQNIYDNQHFFTEYLKLRQNENSYNKLLDEPTMQSLLPAVAGKTVLDMGCGLGDNCLRYKEAGATHVVGIDLSHNMIAQARKRTAKTLGEAYGVEFHVMHMGEIRRLQTQFDVIVSSLSIHYVKDFEGLMQTVYQCLTPGGVLLFSQEHPIATAPNRDYDQDWYTRDREGKALCFYLRDYNRPGQRSVTWLGEKVEKHHRTLSQIVNGIAGAGLFIEQMVEPSPAPDVIDLNDGLYKEFIKPSFLAVRARRPR